MPTTEVGTTESLNNGVYLILGVLKPSCARAASEGWLLIPNGGQNTLCLITLGKLAQVGLRFLLLEQVIQQVGLGGYDSWVSL